MALLLIFPELKHRRYLFKRERTRLSIQCSQLFPTKDEYNITLSTN